MQRHRDRPSRLVVIGVLFALVLCAYCIMYSMRPATSPENARAAGDGYRAESQQQPQQQPQEPPQQPQVEAQQPQQQPQPQPQPQEQSSSPQPPTTRHTPARRVIATAAPAAPAADTSQVKVKDMCTKDDIPDAVRMAASPYRIPYRPVTSPNFTIVMLTHERDAIMKKSLAKLGVMKRVDKILLLWNNPGRAPPDLTKQLTFKMPLVIKPINLTSLMQRFQPFDEIETEAVFMVDDDNSIGERGVQRSFDVWKDHPWGLVGFPWREYKALGGDRYEYLYKVGASYSMVLTGAAFMHKEYLRMFTDTTPPAIYREVTRLFDCEDIAMNLMVADHCRCSAAYRVVPSEFGMLTVHGLSTMKDHISHRNYCMTQFTRNYTAMPLKRKPARCIWK